ncbi:hypothetical protein C8R47DRAFT_1200019 [Mycena vitilis]|nr:hypothetical protein C8R47DRAFT_1200019 [Mycena vitilis]
MDSLPPELHSLKAELACVSPFGGHTTRAMALTSTYFHAISAPFLFYTLAVSSQNQADRLLELLEATPAPKRRIQRLFLGPALHLAPASALRLLHCSAPTVRDLVVMLPSSSSSSSLLGAVFRTQFPHLKALSLRGLLPRTAPSPAGVFAALALSCPALTHLRVSSLRGAPEFARELCDALSMGANDHGFPPNIDPPGEKDFEKEVAELRDVRMRAMLSMLTEEARKRRDGPRIQFEETQADEGDAEKIKVAWLEMPLASSLQTAGLTLPDVQGSWVFTYWIWAVRFENQPDWNSIPKREARR